MGGFGVRGLEPDVELLGEERRGSLVERAVGVSLVLGRLGRGKRSEGDVWVFELRVVGLVHGVVAFMVGLRQVEGSGFVRVFVF